MCKQENWLKRKHRLFTFGILFLSFSACSEKELQSEDVEYRIKPKSELIPFDFTDAEKLIGKVVKHKEGFSCVAVLLECNLQHICIGNDFEIYEVLLQDYTFLDGSPCGKLKE